jgi:formylglycine-generating enzyme required for sulfatase activity
MRNHTTLVVLALMLPGCNGASGTTDGTTALDARRDGPAGPPADGPRGERVSSDGARGDLRRDGSAPPGWTPVSPGTFTMGSPASEPCRVADETQRKVTLTRAFELASTEVTQEQFQGALGYNPSKNAACGPQCPVDQVSWHESAAYCNALSQKQSLGSCYTCTGSGPSVTCTVAAAYDGTSKTIYDCPGFRLPTEAEWEYAYRAGSSTALYNGALTSCSHTDGADANADKIAWYYMNAGGKPHPVGKLQPNAWGLFDLAGNVWEWCHDWHAEPLPTTPIDDPWGPSSGTGRVQKGGSWASEAQYLRAAYRRFAAPGVQYFNYGFRCARTK